MLNDRNSIEYFGITCFCCCPIASLGCNSVAAGDPTSKDSQMSVDLVVGGNENVSNTVVVETTQMQSLSAPARYICTSVNK